MIPPVWMRGAIFMLMSSWKSSLQAYGISTFENYSSPIPSRGHPRFIVTVFADIGIIDHRADQSAIVANRHHVRVRRVEEALPHQLRRAVRDQHVALHLSHSQTSVARAALQRLPREVKESIGV